MNTGNNNSTVTLLIAAGILYIWLKYVMPTASVAQSNMEDSLGREKVDIIKKRALDALEKQNIFFENIISTSPTALLQKRAVYQSIADTFYYYLSEIPWYRSVIQACYMALNSLKSDASNTSSKYSADELRLIYALYGIRAFGGNVVSFNYYDMQQSLSLICGGAPAIVNSFNYMFKFTRLNLK